jgi:hypothetical protein
MNSAYGTRLCHTAKEISSSHLLKKKRAKKKKGLPMSWLLSSLLFRKTGDGTVNAM